MEHDEKQPATMPETPSRLSSTPLFDDLSEPMKLALQRQCDALDAKGWLFQCTGNAATALGLCSIFSRIIADPAAHPDEQALARFYAAFFYQLFGGHSPYIQTMIARAAPQVMADTHTETPHAHTH